MKLSLILSVTLSIVQASQFRGMTGSVSQNMAFLISVEWNDFLGEVKNAFEREDMQKGLKAREKFITAIREAAKTSEKSQWLRFANSYIKDTRERSQENFKSLTPVQKEVYLAIFAEIPCIWNVTDYIFLTAMILGILLLLVGACLFCVPSLKYLMNPLLITGGIITLIFYFLFYSSISGTSTATWPVDPKKTL